MRYGDVSFTESGKLGEIENLIAMIGISKRQQKDNKEISFEEYSNERIESNVAGNWWEYASNEEQMEEYNREMKSRADQREVFSGFEDDYKAQLDEKLKGVDLGTVGHYLSERKKAYQEAQSKQNKDDAFEKIENASQIDATIYAQNRVKVLESKNKSK